MSESSPSDAKTSAASPSVEFVQLFTQYQRRLFLFILSQIPNPIEAEEVLQETNVVIWSKFATFREGTNFLAWVSQIANFEVMKYRTKKRRDRARFSDDFIDAVSHDALDRSDELEERRLALVDCIAKLRSKDRKLIEQRYAPGEKAKDVAAQIGRPANSVYQSLGRIRKVLMDCIQRKMQHEQS